MQVGTVFVGWVLQGFIMSNSEWESRREEEGAGGQPLAWRFPIPCGCQVHKPPTHTFKW